LAKIKLVEGTRYTHRWYRLYASKLKELHYSEGRSDPIGPLIKRCPIDQTQQTQEHVPEQKHKEST
jgi:hypothetical protein